MCRALWRVIAAVLSLDRRRGEWNGPPAMFGPGGEYVTEWSGHADN
jgi:hypothetical protein